MPTVERWRAEFSFLLRLSNVLDHYKNTLLSPALTALLFHSITVNFEIAFYTNRPLNSQYSNELQTAFFFFFFNDERYNIFNR